MLEIEKLCALLEKRGIEYTKTSYEVHWSDKNDHFCRAFQHPGNHRMYFVASVFTAEKAVDFTLGREGCIMYACDGGFANTNLPVWQCSCGAFATQYTDMTTFYKPRYCPNCGRAVVDD